MRLQCSEFRTNQIFWETYTGKMYMVSQDAFVRAKFKGCWSMEHLAELCERIAATTKKTEKVAMVAEYFRARELQDAAITAVFLSGRAFPAFDERTLQIGGSALWKLVAEITGAQVLGHDGDLLQFLGGGGDALASFSQLVHENRAQPAGHRRRRCHKLV